MNMLSGRHCLLTTLTALVLWLPPVNLPAQTAKVDAQHASSPRRASAYETQKEKMNAWTVGLAGGLLEGAPLRLAAEIARVVDDGPNLHVLPIVTRGATENLNSLLYLRGVDTAIINSDALEEYKIQVLEVRRKITYLLNLFPSELHIFVRPEIQSLQDLAGKKVNFNTQGTAAAYSGPLIFSRSASMQKTPSFLTKWRWSRCARAKWRPWFSSRRSRLTPSYADAGTPASSSFQ